MDEAGRWHRLGVGIILEISFPSVCVFPCKLCGLVVLPGHCGAEDHPCSMLIAALIAAFSFVPKIFASGQGLAIQNTRDSCWIQFVARRVLTPFWSRCSELFRARSDAMRCGMTPSSSFVGREASAP